MGQRVPTFFFSCIPEYYFRLCAMPQQMSQVRQQVKFERRCHSRHARQYVHSYYYCRSELRLSSLCVRPSMQVPSAHRAEKGSSRQHESAWRSLALAYKSIRLKHGTLLPGIFFHCSLSCCRRDDSSFRIHSNRLSCEQFHKMIGLAVGSIAAFANTVAQNAANW